MTNEGQRDRQIRHPFWKYLLSTPASRKLASSPETKFAENGKFSRALPFSKEKEQLDKRAFGRIFGEEFR
jgi:hypothetical protein